MENLKALLLSLLPVIRLWTPFILGANLLPACSPKKLQKPDKQTFETNRPTAAAGAGEGLDDRAVVMPEGDSFGRFLKHMLQ